MACGTGKTLAALRLTEQLTGTNGRVLFLAPSIALIAQALREWTAQAMAPIHTFAVCSDTKVGRNAEDIRTHDLAYPATTDATKLVAAANTLTKDRRTVVFSTYQSIQVLAEAQQQGFGGSDLIICDEAHRTTGLTLPGEDPSAFVKVHHNQIIAGQKRLYMTATPRIYADQSKTKASEVNAPCLLSQTRTSGHGFRYGKDVCTAPNAGRRSALWHLGNRRAGLDAAVLDAAQSHLGTDYPIPREPGGA